MEKTLENPKKSVKDAIKAGVRPKKTTIKTQVKKKAKKPTPPTNKVEDVPAALPESKQKVYVKAKAVGDTKVIKVDINTITATSQTVYVADIHAQNAQVLATAYWVIMPNTPNVVLRVTKDEYDALLKRKEAQSINHLYSVVDNAVFPSLTYGSWKLKEIKDFPTLEQIDEYDAKFRTMEVNVHNPPVIGQLMDDIEEDDSEFDFSDEDEDDSDEEEFDFS